MSATPTIDLFAGAGGLSLGALRAGADVRLLVDNDPVSCTTARRSSLHAEAVIYQADVTGLTGQGLREMAGPSNADPLLVVGGPPCQAFSKAAYWADDGAEAAYRRARSRGDHAIRPTYPPPAGI